MKSSPLLFDWPHRHRIQFVLPAAIILALLAHAGILVLIGIVHPQPRFDGPNPARVYFLSPENASQSRIQGLLLSSDPALYAPKQGLPPSDITTAAAYVPQFESTTPALIALPSRPKPVATLAPPSARVKLPTLKRSVPRKVSAAKLLHLTAPLAARSTEDLRRAFELPDMPTGTDSASFLVGISHSGEVIHIVPNRSTGDPETDSILLNIIRSVRFSAIDTRETTWGMVEIRPGKPQ